MKVPKDLSLKNRLIAGLPPTSRSALLEHSELVDLSLHAELLVAGRSGQHAYFPIDSFVSLTLALDGESDLEIAMVGSEGMFNTTMVLGDPTSTLTSVVQGAGRALRIHRNALRLRRAEDAGLRQVLLGYASVILRQTAQRAACLRSHSVPQRLARSLLMVRDRAHSNELFLTHESLSLMIGARRDTVSHAAGAFQKAGVISYTRGYVLLLDEAALALAACPCYQTDLQSYSQLQRHPEAVAPHPAHPVQALS
jgi:CRP-like cAMP-binding protein